MRIIGLVISAALVVGCASEVPDGDVQISCERTDAGRELCAWADVAAAELRPSLPYLLIVSDPDVLGVTWRSTDQWRVVARPAGYRIPSGELGGEDTVLCDSGPLSATSYARQTIYVGECAMDGRWPLGVIVRHELGHALGYAGHLGPADVMAPEVEYRGADRPYSDADVEAIASVRRGERNDIVEALWVD